ncbi:hypothetical protein AMR72_15535 [Flavobacterium psychrophilum]|nr:hypothetical protein AMR72_15535 [Flavobacterium psychrophilum]AOE53797.1 hypothetical protein ALW18_15525 [Flavobacterium psychrophilum]
MSTTYQLTIFRQSRILPGILIFPIAIILSLLTSTKSTIAAFALIAASLYLWYYFAIGYLQITISDNSFRFKWQRKLFFNYKAIENVAIENIEYFVIDKQFLRKIVTDTTTIKINTSKIKVKDANRLIDDLNKIAIKNNIRIIDIWDEWQEKGYLNIANKINTVLIGIAFSLIIILTIVNGFQKQNLLPLLLLLPKMISYGNQMKSR